VRQQTVDRRSKPLCCGGMVIPTYRVDNGYRVTLIRNPESNNKKHDQVEPITTKEGLLAGKKNTSEKKQE